LEVTNKKCNNILLEDGLNRVFDLILKVKNDRNRIYFIGNGGSSSISSHAAIDFINVAKVSSHALTNSAVLTCLANDYGYENSYSRYIETSIESGDILIAISSSGMSKNIINAVNVAKEISSTVVTLSGFDSKNTLRKLGDINIWSNSTDYGIVEMSHQFILHNLSDRFLDNSVEITK